MLGDYWRQVWQLGRLYSGHTFVENPLREGFARSLSWAGFHSALIVPAARFWWKDRDSGRWRFAAWAMLSLAADLAAGRPHRWRDIEMDTDNRAAARILALVAGPGDTLFVWGYRPDLYVYTRLPAATRFLESQPLSGVLADRRLFDTIPIPAPGLRRTAPS